MDFGLSNPVATGFFCRPHMMFGIFARPPRPHGGSPLEAKTPNLTCSNMLTPGLLRSPHSRFERIPNPLKKCQSFPTLGVVANDLFGWQPPSDHDQNQNICTKQLNNETPKQLKTHGTDQSRPPPPPSLPGVPEFERHRHWSSRPRSRCHR